MVVVMHVGEPEAHVENVIEILSSKGFDVLRTSGQQQTVLCAIGVQREFELRQVRVLEGVADVHRITSPYKLASRTWQKENTVVSVAGLRVGSNDVALLHDIEPFVHIGAGNMQNESLLREVGKKKKPVLLRRNALASISEWLVSADIILNEGNPNVVLCEGAARPHAGAMTAGLFRSVDIAVIPEIKQSSHLPILIDPSCVQGGITHQYSMARAAVAAGADGIIWEQAIPLGLGRLSSEASESAGAVLSNELDLIAGAIGRSLRGIDPK